MTHISPSVYTVWSVVSTTLAGFLLTHIWKFDRFQCLKWGRGQSSGAFKRVMTFSYLVSVPLLMTYSIGMMVIKYREGFAVVPGHGIIPMPYQLWSPQNTSLLLPLQMLFSVAWGLEIVTHMEELCFWLFLITVGPKHTSWFRSTQFRVWMVSSLISVAGMPIVTWFTRSNPLKCEAYTFLAGSIGSLLITVWSIQVLWVFPGFVSRVKSAGGEPEVVVRLTTFHDLNVTRVVFRFFFVVPTLILAIDGVRTHSHVNESAVWTDLLATLAGIGLTVSSAFTLLIFFPRSIEREAGYMPRRKSSAQTNNSDHQAVSLHRIDSIVEDPRTPTQNPFASAPPRVQFPPKTAGSPYADTEEYERSYLDDKPRSDSVAGGVWEMVTTPPSVPYNHPYDNGETFELGSRTHLRPSRPPRLSLHPMLMNYSSPINFTQGDSSGSPRPARRHRPVNPV